jgi:hypothetical protein
LTPFLIEKHKFGLEGRWVGVVEQALVALLLFGLSGAVYLLVLTARDHAEEPAARFRRGTLGAFGLMLAVSSGAGLTAVLAEFGTGSAAWLVAMVTINLALQPVALMLCWIGVRKITLGLCGRVAYAWRCASETDLADLLPAERRQLPWFCVLQGVMALPIGIGISFASASPLVLWFIA